MTDGLVLFPKSTFASGPTAFDWWRQEASRCGINLSVAFFEDLMLRYDAGHASAYVEGVRLPDQAFAVMRGYSREISSHFESCGVPVINHWAAMELSLDKILTHQALTAAGLPTPFTVMPMAPLSYEDACEAMGAYEFIVKQNDGSRGVNVFLVSNKGEYDSAVGILGPKAMLQRYVSSSCGRDLRVWTVGERAVGCVLRHSDSSFLSNYSQGGSADPYALSVEAADLAVKAARSLGLEFAGIDLLFTPEGGFTVCEVNGNAGFRTLSSIDRNSSILRNLFEYITDKYA